MESAGSILGAPNAPSFEISEQFRAFGVDVCCHRDDPRDDVPPVHTKFSGEVFFLVEMGWDFWAVGGGGSHGNECEAPPPRRSGGPGVDEGAFIQSEDRTPLPLTRMHMENPRLLSGVSWEDHSSPICGEFPDCA